MAKGKDCKSLISGSITGSTSNLWLNRERNEDKKRSMEYDLTEPDAKKSFKPFEEVEDE